MKYTKEVLEEAVNNSESIAGVMRYLGARTSGGLHSHLSRRIRKFGLDTTHFTGQGHAAGKSYPKRRRHWSEILVEQSSTENKTKSLILRRAMIDYGIDYTCSECGQGPTWMGKPLTLAVDHIDGNTMNHSPRNVRFLCYHCHSQTDNWGGKKLRTEKSVCPDCGERKQTSSVRCATCHTKLQKVYGHKRKSRKTVIDWPAPEEVKKLVDETNFTRAGKTLGVSDNAVRKYLRKHNLL